MDTVGIGIVGAGKIFEQHAAACNSLAGRARLVAIADINEAQLQKAAGKYSIPFAAADYRILLDRQDIDVITVCTPPVLHERVVVEALEAGKFVICEKPLAHTLESADRIIAVAKKYPGQALNCVSIPLSPRGTKSSLVARQRSPGKTVIRPLSPLRQI